LRGQVPESNGKEGHQHTRNPYGGVGNTGGQANTEDSEKGKRVIDHGVTDDIPIFNGILVGQPVQVYQTALYSAENAQEEWIGGHNDSEKLENRRRGQKGWQTPHQGDDDDFDDQSALEPDKFSGCVHISSWAFGQIWDFYSV